MMDPNATINSNESRFEKIETVTDMKSSISLLIYYRING